jgi:hypothetical protein
MVAPPGSEQAVGAESAPVGGGEDGSRTVVTLDFAREKFLAAKRRLSELQAAEVQVRHEVAYWGKYMARLTENTLRADYGFPSAAAGVEDEDSVPSPWFSPDASVPAVANIAKSEGNTGQQRAAAGGGGRKRPAAGSGGEEKVLAKRERRPTDGRCIPCWNLSRGKAAAGPHT